MKTDLFSDDDHRKQIYTLGNPLPEISTYIDCAALAAEVNLRAGRPISRKKSR